MRKKIVNCYFTKEKDVRKSSMALGLIITGLTSFAQTLPVGTPVLEETWRRLQIKGERDMDISFTVRPVYAATPEGYDSLYIPGNSLPGKKLNRSISYAKGMAGLLPVTLKQQYNSHHPYGWNDGAMIPAKGYQALLSAGVYVKIGHLSIQLQPEMVYAQNRNFAAFPGTHSDSTWRKFYYFLNQIDNPEKFGDGSYTKFFPGQSSVRFNYKKLSIGVSNESLAWGPGVRNNLVMSNNAPGFPHISFNTTAPVHSGIGSFEGQVIAGRLKGSGILPPDTGRTFDGFPIYNPKNEAANRYLNGMIITWQPKWTKGLHLGFTRLFYLYESDLQRNIGGYLPIVSSFFKGNTRGEDDKQRDQLLSVFLRMILPKEKAEFYAEYGRNDHSQNFRDLVLEPEHARAYIIGVRKLFSAKKDADLELMMEITNLQGAATGMLREIPMWYVHHQVRHGYTNLGQVIGAGIGPGSSSQTVGISWIKGFKKFGMQLERIVRNNDFYYSAFGQMGSFSGHWVDLAINLNKNWQHKHFLYAADLSFVKSYNYQWRSKIQSSTQPGLKNDVLNLHAAFSVAYVF